MTWLEKLKYIELQLEVILHIKEDVSKILEYCEAKEIAEYLHLEKASTYKSHQGWMLLLFLKAFNKYQQGKKENKEELIDQYSRNSDDIVEITNGLYRLELLGCISTNEEDRSFVLKRKIAELVLLHKPIPDLYELQIRINKAVLFYDSHQFLLLDENEIEIHRKNLNELTGYIFYKKTILETLHIFKKLKKLEQLFLILVLIKKYIGQNTFTEYDFYNLAVKSHDGRYFFKEIKYGQGPLFKNGYIKMIDNSTDILKLELTDKFIKSYSIERIFSLSSKHEEPEPTIKDNPELPDEYFTFIDFKNINTEELYFNKQLQSKLDLYKKLLIQHDDVFKETEKLGAKLNLFFEGPPGCGKTAFAYQLARQTKRNLYLVSWQNFRDRWIGESEKNLRKIFDGIDKLSETSSRKPIILINEAESFLSRRVAVDQSADQGQNNNVSMVLEWMEKTSPTSIVIFTANQKELLDQAFDRRINTISFDQPNDKTRLQIWKNKFAKNEIELSNDTLGKLNHLTISGAEIDKIFRNYKLHQLAYKLKTFDIHTFLSFSDQQQHTNTKPIGFKIERHQENELLMGTKKKHLLKW